MNRKLRMLPTLVVTLALLAACGSGTDAASTGAAPAAEDAAVQAVALSATEAPDETGTAGEASTESGGSVTEAEAGNGETHEADGDTEWDEADVVAIGLDGSAISVEGEGVSVDGSLATITAGGTYRLSGTLDDGQVAVDTDSEDVVRLILSGAHITSSTSAAINVIDAEKVVVVLEDGTQNTLTDAETYVYDDPDEDEPNAALFSKADMTIAGSGELTVTGNANDGIASKDGLIIAGGNITVDAVDDGIRGKDYLIVENGTIDVESGGDGLKSDNDADTTLGYISIEGGAITVNAGGDAIQAESDVLVGAGDLTITAGGGSGAVIGEDDSAKGIKGNVSVVIDGGTFAIDTADDAVHSNGSITVNGGTFVIASGDDAMHADARLEVNDGAIQVTTSYEGLESAVIVLNGGDIDVIASDDGLNVAGGNDGSGMGMGPGRGGFGGGQGQGGPGQGGPGGGQPPAEQTDGEQTAPAEQAGDAQAAPAEQDGGFPAGAAGAADAFATSSDYYLEINGGTITVDAGGDGLDSNGSIAMTGGTVIVNGPTNSGNGALDYQGQFTLSGGTLIAAGASGMAQAPSDASTQNSVLINFDETLPAGTLVHIEASDGTEVLTFAPSKEFQSLVVSSPALVSGADYEVTTGGSSTGAVTDGVYTDGTYTPGASAATFTISSTVTQVGNRGGGRGGW